MSTTDRHDDRRERVITQTQPSEEISPQLDAVQTRHGVDAHWAVAMFNPEEPDEQWIQSTVVLERGDIK